MERFVIGVAFAAAALYALSASTGGQFMDHMNIRFGDSALTASSGSGGEAVATTARTFAATQLRFEDGFAVVRVIPEERVDMAVTLLSPGNGAAPAPRLRLEGDTLVVDGDLGSRLRRCEADGAVIDGAGLVPRAQAPVVEVRMPSAATVSIGSAGLGDIGPAKSLKLSLRGCGDTVAGDVSGALVVKSAGGGALRAGSSGTADVSMAGSGGVFLGRTTSLNVDLAGSGEVTVAQLDGPFTADLAGSGSVTVAAGTVTKAETDIAGSGDVTIGAGVERLEASTMGSGTVTVTGAVGSLKANIAGSGDVRVGSITGASDKSIMGSGEVVVAGAR